MRSKPSSLGLFSPILLFLSTFTSLPSTYQSRYLLTSFYSTHHDQTSLLPPNLLCFSPTRSRPSVRVWSPPILSLLLSPDPDAFFFFFFTAACLLNRLLTRPSRPRLHLSPLLSLFLLHLVSQVFMPAIRCPGLAFEAHLLHVLLLVSSFSSLPEVRPGCPRPWV